MKTEAFYRDREGHVWPLGGLQAHPTFQRMVVATRLDTGETVTLTDREVRVVDERGARNGEGGE